ncbi:MFS transporter [Pseudomonas indica]|uniref:MFS transporter n=1 Tax=Pseudomonas indica TaxID=137658 RepID=UPI003FD454E6
MLRTFSLLHLIIVTLLGHVVLTGSRITLSLNALTLELSESMIGGLTALFALAPMLLATSTGHLIDRIGPLKPMIAGSLALFLGCLVGQAGNTGALALAATIIGTGFMAIHVASQLSVGLLSSEQERTQNFGRLSLAFSLSSFSGPVIAGLLIEHADFADAYLAFGAFSLLTLLLLVRDNAVSSIAVTSSRPRGTSQSFNLLRHATIRRTYWVGLLLGVAWDLFVFIIPLHGTRLGLSSSTIGMILGCFSLGILTMRLITSWIPRPVREWTTLLLILALVTVCYLSLPLAQHPISLSLLAALLGLALGPAQPIVLTLLHRYTPEDRIGETSGLRVTLTNACQVGFPLAFGSVGALWGTEIVFGIMAGITAATTVFLAVIIGKSSMK